MANNNFEGIEQRAEGRKDWWTEEKIAQSLNHQIIMKKMVKFIKNYIDVFAIFAVFFSAFTFYIAALDGDFVFDDLPLISSDPFYHEGSDISFADCFTRTWWRKDFSQGLYRPLTILSYLLNARILGTNPFAFRLTNLILHSLLCSVLYILFFRLSANRKIAYLSAILFALHPIHAEAVIPGSGRADLLASLFLVLGLIIHIAYKGNHLIRFLLIFISSLFAALSKEFGVLLLPLCIIYDLIFNCEIRKSIFRMMDLAYHKKILFGEGKRMDTVVPAVSAASLDEACLNTSGIHASSLDFAALVSYFASFLSVIVYFLMRVFLISTVFPRFSDAHFWSDNHLGLLSFWGRLPTALWLQAYALWKFIYPRYLSHDYSYAQIIPINSFLDLRNSQTLICFVIIVFFLCFLFRENRKLLVFCVFAYFVSVLPTANIIVPTGTIFGERLFFFPSIFLSFFAIGFLSFLLEKKIVSGKIVAIFAIAVFISFFLRLSQRIGDFKDQRILAFAGIKTSPESFKMWNNYALQLYDMKLYAEAEEGFTRSLNINPSNFQAIRNRANARLYLGKSKEALDDFLTCLKMGTKDPQVFNKAGALFAIEGNKEKAIELWKKSLELNKNQPEILKALSELEGGSE